MELEKNINFILTYEQAQMICNYFNRDIEKIEDFEICELLDRLIDEVTIINY